MLQHSPGVREQGEAVPGWGSGMCTEQGSVTEAAGLGKSLCLGLGLLWERSKHGVCGNSTIRQVLKAEPAFVWWVEIESETPRDKGKSFCN